MQTCPVMSGGPKYEYRWQDNDRYKKPTVLSASDYIAELMHWIEQLINDESVFPTKVGESIRCAVFSLNISSFERIK